MKFRERVPMEAEGYKLLASSYWLLATGFLLQALKLFGFHNTVNQL